MSTWHTNSWGNFCDPYWELICLNKWYPETSDISTPPKIAVGTHFHARTWALKLLWYSYLLEKPLGLLPFSVSLLSGSTVLPENTYSRILKVTGQVWESQKWISINTNHSYHQRSSPLASLNWSNNKARFSFNQPNRKTWDAKLFDVKHPPHNAFLLWNHH